jgi:ADP-ribose pyrophosphatase YjhB (NUDIX family)
MRVVRRYVSRAIHIKHDKILLAKSARKNSLFLPGGEINICESAAAALLREINEELSRSAEIIDFIGIIENNWIEGDTSYYETNYLFSVNIEEGRFEPISAEEGLSFEWVSLTDVDRVDIRPVYLKQYIKKIINVEFEALWFSNF